MVQHLSPEEHRLMVERYQRAYGLDVVEVASPITVDRSSGQSEQFSLHERVLFGRPNTLIPGRTCWSSGVVVLFLRFHDPVAGLHTFAVILTDGPDGHARQYRVPVECLSRES